MKSRTKLIRLAASVLVIGVIVFGGLMIVRSQSELATVEADDTVTVAETTTVSTGTLNLSLDAVGSLAPAATQALAFEVSAPVTEVLVSVGDWVQAGSVLAILDTTNAEASIRQSQLMLAQQQAALDALRAPAEEIDIKLAEAQVSLAEAQLYSASQNNSTSAESIEIARLQEELARNSLWQAQLNRGMRVEQAEARGDVNWVQQQEFDASVNSAETNAEIAALDYQNAQDTSSQNWGSIANANESLARAQASLETLRNGATEEEIRAAEISVEQAQLSLDDAEETLKNYVLIAPFDGIVAEENLTVGVLPPTESAITLINPDYYTVDLSIAEADVVEVKVGQPVNLTVQALANATVDGEITSVAVTPTMDGELVTYTARVTVEPPSEITLRPGMSATATITLEEHNNVILVPNRFISTDATTGETTVMIETDPGVYTAIPVTIGARNAESSEITSGVSVGQTLVLLARESDATTEQAGQGGLGLFSGGGAGFPAGGAPPNGGGFNGGGAGFRGG